MSMESYLRMCTVLLAWAIGTTAASTITETVVPKRTVTVNDNLLIPTAMAEMDAWLNYNLGIQPVYEWSDGVNSFLAGYKLPMELPGFARAPAPFACALTKPIPFMAPQVRGVSVYAITSLSADLLDAATNRTTGHTRQISLYMTVADGDPVPRGASVLFRNVFLVAASHEGDHTRRQIDLGPFGRKPTVVAEPTRLVHGGRAWVWPGTYCNHNRYG